MFHGVKQSNNHRHCPPCFPAKSRPSKQFMKILPMQITPMAYPGRSASSARYRAARSVLDCGGRAQRRHRFGVSERNGIGKSFVPIPNGAGGVRVSGDSPACFGVFPPSAPIRVHLRFIIPLCFAFSVFFAVKSVSAFSLSRVPRVSRFKNSPPRFAVRLVFPKSPCLPPMVVIK